MRELFLLIAMGVGLLAMGLFAAIVCGAVIGWVANHDTHVPRYERRGRGLCVACCYNLTGNASGVCPECGTVVAKAESLS